MPIAFLKSAFDRLGAAERRLVYLRRTSYHKPLERLPEHQAERKSEAVRVEGLPHEVFHGLNITDDQAVESERLGIRQKLARTLNRWFAGRPAAGGGVVGEAGEQIVDERVTQKLKDICTREVSVRQEERNWVTRTARSALGFLRNVRSFVTREHADDSGQVFEDIYDRNPGIRGWFQRWVMRYDRYPAGGRPVTVNEMRYNVSRDMWNGLPAGEQAIILGHPAIRALVGIPIGPIGPQDVIRAFAARESSPQQLREIRQALRTAGVVSLGEDNNAELFPASERRPSPTLFDRLLQLKEVEADERKKLLGVTVYDATRLQNFVNGRLRQEPRIFNLVDEILIESALYPIQDNPDAQALLAYIEYKLDTDPAEDFDDPNPAPPPPRLITQQPRLRRDLEQIRAILPSTEEKPDEKEKSETQEQLENVQKLSEVIQQTYDGLKEQYAEAPSLGNRIYDARVQLYSLPPPAAGAGATVHDDARQALNNQINELENNRQKIQTNVAKLEARYRDSRQDLLATLISIEPIPATLTNLTAFNGLAAATFNDSTPQNLFGPINPPPPPPPPAPYPPPPAWARTAAPHTPSAFEIHISNGFNPNQLKGMFKEIKSHYHKAIKKTKPQKITCRQLLYMLKERDLDRAGIQNQELRRKYAFMATNLMITDVKNTAFYMATNERLSMRLGEAPGGIKMLRIFSRIKKFAASYAGSRKYLRGEDILEFTAGLNEKFSVFRDLKRDATITELRELIAEQGGIDQQTLFEFSEQLKETVVGFNMLKKEGKVNLYDRHAMQLEGLVNILNIVQQEIRCEIFFNEIRGTGGNKVEAILKKIREDEESSEKSEKALREQITGKGAEWKQLFSKRIFEKKFREQYRAARKYITDNKMNDGEAEEYLRSQGLLAADDAYATREGVREAWETTKEKSKKSYEAVKTSKVTGAVVKGGEYAVYKPLKFMAWDAPKWTLEKAWGIGTFPFRLLGALGSDLSKIGKKKEGNKEEKKDGKKDDKKAKAKK